MKKIVVQIIIVILILGALGNAVLASSFNLEMTPSKNTIAPGEELEIALDISNIDLADEGLNTIEGSLEYDHNVFEEVKNTNFTSANGWTFTYNSEDGDQNGKFLGILLSEGIRTNQTIAKITLKAKMGINDQTSIIKIKDIKTNDGTNIVKETDKEISIKIEKKQDNSGNGNNNGNSNVGINGSNNGGIVPEKPNTSYNGNKLPQTGTNEILILGMTMFTLVIGIVCFIKYKKM